jgi:hypothetical protein
VLKTVPHAKDSKQPAETELKNTLSKRMLPLYTPVLATASITSRGEKESKVISGNLISVKNLFNKNIGQNVNPLE